MAKGPVHNFTFTRDNVALDNRVPDLMLQHRVSEGLSSLNPPSYFKYSHLILMSRHRHIFGCDQAFTACQFLGPKLTHQSERLITALLDDFTCCHGTYPLMENKYSLEK